MANKTLIRIPNFSPAEKEHLMMIAMKYGAILEDKKTNRGGLEEKDQTWKKIEVEFNNTAPIVSFRNQDQLKRLYENRKKDLRKKMANHRKEIYLTGGGPSPADIKLDKVDNLLAQIINEKTVKGFCSEFDSDYIKENVEQPVKKRKPNEEQIILYESNKDDHDVQIFEYVPLEQTESATIDVIDIIPEQTTQVPEYRSGRCPPTVLQKPINKKLVSNLEATTSPTVNTPAIEARKNKTPTSSRRRPVGGIRALTSSDVGEKYNILLDKRTVLVEKQLQQIIEANNFVQEEHKQKIKNLKLEEENLRLAKEEQLLKIELLKTNLHMQQTCKKNV